MKRIAIFTLVVALVFICVSLILYNWYSAFKLTDADEYGSDDIDTLKRKAIEFVLDHKPKGLY